MTVSAPPRYILTLSCGDRPGIVGAVGTFLAEHRCNIVESAQFGDVDTNRFMMRVCFERLAGAPDEIALRESFATVATPLMLEMVTSPCETVVEPTDAASIH